MKLLLPILHQLKIDSGFGIRNPLQARSLSSSPQVWVRLWKDFETIDSQKVSFQDQDVLRLFLTDIFSPNNLLKATLATVEFDPDTFSSEDRTSFFKNSFEAQCLFKDQVSQKWTAVLYDMIPDKKPGHTYAPILHCAHSAYISTDNESYAILANFRPPSLSTEKKLQSMALQMKSSQGDLLQQTKIEFPFNATTVLSFKDLFESVGGFKPGFTLNFKGGESQFAIFTLFKNHKTGSLGIEHSLAPFYYCSGVADPLVRQTFYKNAFSDVKDLI